MLHAVFMMFGDFKISCPSVSSKKRCSNVYYLIQQQERASVISIRYYQLLLKVNAKWRTGELITTIDETG